MSDDAEVTELRPISEIKASGYIQDGMVTISLELPGAELAVEYANNDGGYEALSMLMSSFPMALEQVLANMKETT